MSSFEASATYAGAREGFVFKTGDQGLGYYADTQRLDPAAAAEQLAALKLRDEEEAARLAKAEAEIKAVLAADPPRPFAVGMRVADEDGHKATVRYVGPVKSAKNSKAEYIGVEWDDAERGKHDGSLEPKGGGEKEVYFRTAQPTAGSFMKPAKLSRGVAFAAALFNSDGQDPSSAILKDAAVGQPGEGRLRPLEEPLFFLNLEDNLLGSLADAFAIASRCPNLMVLRLGLNRFADATSATASSSAVTTAETAGTAESAPAVKLVVPGSLPALPKLHSLVLTACDLTTWAAVEAVAAALPALQELSLSGNKRLGLAPSRGGEAGCMLGAVAEASHPPAAEAATTPDGEGAGSGSGSGSRSGGSGSGSDDVKVCLPSLKVLDMGYTAVTLWRQVEALGVACPSLVKLNLSHAAIATIDPTITATPAAAAATADDRGAEEEDGCCDECGDTFEGDAASSPPAAPLSGIAELGLDGCKIAAVGELRKLRGALPKLAALSLGNVPLVVGFDRRRIFRLVLPVLPALKRLNDVPITGDVRADAEKDFLTAALRASVPAAAALLQGLVKTAKTKTEQQQQQEEEEQKQDDTTAAPSSLAVPMVVKEGIQRDSQVPAAGDEAVPFGLERLVTLEEFAEMEGALDAMRTVLADQHPEFAACAAAYGAPEVFARMEHLAESPIIEP